MLVPVTLVRKFKCFIHSLKPLQFISPIIARHIEYMLGKREEGRGGSRAAATSKTSTMECFVIIVNGFSC